MQNHDKDKKVFLIYDKSYNGGWPLSDERFPDYADTEIRYIWHYIAKKRPTYKTLYDTFTVNDEIYNSKILYIPIISYTTGDTFSTIFGEEEVLGVFKSHKNASKYMKHKLNEEGYHPWDGYFETIESTKVIALPVKQQATRFTALVTKLIKSFKKRR